jgi:hypothetical protein
MKNTTIAIDEFTNEELKKFCKANRMTKKAFITNALTYFRQSGINPLIHETPKIELTKIEKRLEASIQILKAIESKVLIPNHVETQNKMEDLRALFVKLGNHQIQINKVQAEFREEFLKNKNG